MSLLAQREEVHKTITNALRNKMARHNPEPNVMPFHTRLLGKDRLALYSFIHSLNTSFGTSIFEPVAAIISRKRFVEASLQQPIANTIYSGAQNVIQNILDRLGTADLEPNKESEIAAIREHCRAGEAKTVRLTRVDLKLVSSDNEVYYIDLKTAKPNAGDFKGYKRTLLEWAAAAMAEDPEIKINTLLAIPYNPYAPKPYQRWTIRGMIDLDKELFVAEKFWDFLAGEEVYEELLDIFEAVGISLRNEIDQYFAKYL